MLLLIFGEEKEKINLHVILASLLVSWLAEYG